MNLNTLGNAALSDHLLKDGTWQKADFYDLSTGSIFWNRAGVISLPKTSAKTPELALIYLLQNEAKTLGIWERTWAEAIPGIPDFIHFILAEKRFTNTEGQNISIEIFWEKYSSIIAGITTEPDFECSINELPEPFSDLIEKSDIIQVICFDNNWNEQNYFIETKTAWLLFHWTSAA